MNRTRRWAALAASGLTVVCLTACGTTAVTSAGDTATGSSSAAAGDGPQGCTDDVATASGPVSMTDSLGRTVDLTEPAKRVVVLEWQQTEDLLTLCVTPVGAASIDGYATYVSAEKLPDTVTNVGERGEPDLDALYGTDPDLIIMEAYSPDDELLAQLEQRDVPVLATIGADTSGQVANMKKVFSLIGQATGRSERADQVLAAFDEHLADAQTQVAQANLSTRDFVFFDGWIESGNVVIRPYGKGALFTELGEDLGLTAAWTDAINASYGSGGVDPSYGLAQTDIEGLTAVGEANLIYANDGTAESYVPEIRKSPIWTGLPAVEQGRAFEFPSGIWGAGGPRSTSQAIDAFVTVMTEA